MNNKDYYSILGVSRTADDKEIKKAFRKLAKKYHPDTNQGNANAEQRFKEINEAYDILGDPKKRELYDKYGDIAFQEGFDPEAYEAYRRGGFYGGADPRNGGQYQSYTFDGDLGDLFSGLFGSRGKTARPDFNGFSGFSGFTGKGGMAWKGSDHSADISVTLEEAAFGCDKTFTLTDATGKQSSLQVHIPAGIDEGQKVRLKGKGAPGQGGAENGDLFLQVHILPKKGFERKGRDLYVTATIPFTTAALGGEAVVPTLGGSVVCKIKAGTQSGSKIRLKGKGIVSMKDPSVHGDEYAVIQIEVPRSLTPEQKQKLQEFAQLGRQKQPGRTGRVA